MKKKNSPRAALPIRRMAWRGLLTAAVLLLPGILCAEYTIFYENGKKGVKDDRGNVTVAPRYDYLYPLSGSDNARFGGGGVYGMIDMATGKELLPARYKGIGDFYCGLAYINDNGKYGFVNKAGEIVIAPQFDSASSFHEGTAEVHKSGKRYYIGVDGKEFAERPNPSTLAKKEYATAAPAPQPESVAPAEHEPEESAAAAEAEETPQAQKVDADWRRNTPTPHIDPQLTRFLVKNVDFDNLPQVSEGIFYIQEYNRAIGYASYYGFWTIDGHRLFPPIYEGFTTEQPRFDNGACVVKATGTKRPSPTILYADGTTKALSHEWNAMTQFYDGVAMVREILDLRTTNLFYINTRGERIWPHLAENATRGSIVVVMRPIRDGLRAYYSNAARAWGFLSSDGSIAIRPRFSEVRDFANGYALAILDGKAVFIDKKGSVAVTVPADVPSLAYSFNVSNVSDGYFAVSEGNGAPTTFYDLTGRAVKTCQGGATGFADGNAFALNEKYGTRVNVLDSRFKAVAQWPFETEEFTNDKPVFATTPYFTFDKWVTINTAGAPVMYVPHGIFVNDRLGQFSPDGFASAKSEFMNPADNSETFTYTGYVDTEGRYRVVFSTEPKAGGPFRGRLPGPQPVKPGPQPPGPLPPVDTVPQGPVGPGENAVRYRVRVIASPDKGGKVYGSGEYAYGDTIRVTGTPAKGYELSCIESNRPSSATSTFNRFVVRGDMDITCCFVPEDTVGAIANGTMQGMMKQMPLPVYLQTGGEGNRYSQPTCGFMAIICDDAATTSGTSTDGKASLSVNFFFVPMNILGVEESGGKRYLRFDGGVMKYGNLGVTDHTGAGLLNNPLLQMMIAFDGADRGELCPGSYRVEILDGAPDGASMTLGMMQRRSPRYGWISADDESFHKPLGGFFIKRTDKGLSADMFNGVTLKKAPQRTVQWEPSADFYGGDASLMQAAGEALGRLFRRSVADTPLSDYDMQQFSTDLDNNLFKMK